MKIAFESNKLENSVRIFQSNGLTRIRIANRNNTTGKISLSNIYRKQLERDRIDVKEVCLSLEIEYQNWLYSTSPLRSLSKEQNEKLIKDMGAVNVLAVCFQDKIDSLKVLNNLDLFGEVTKDLQELKDNILSFTNKVSKVTGIDMSVMIGDTADDVNNLIDSRL